MKRIVMSARLKDILVEAEALARKQLADVLRTAADAESDPRVTRRLREVADAFECGQRPGPVGGNSE